MEHIEKFFKYTKEGVYKAVMARGIVIQGFEDQHFFYLNNSGRFIIVEARSGLSVAGGNTLKQARTLSKSALNKIGNTNLYFKIRFAWSKHGINPKYNTSKEV